LRALTLFGGCWRNGFASAPLVSLLLKEFAVVPLKTFAAGRFRSKTDDPRFDPESSDRGKRR
jgi:hypothetical protein